MEKGREKVREEGRRVGGMKQWWVGMVSGVTIVQCTLHVSAQLILRSRLHHSIY